MSIVSARGCLLSETFCSLRWKPRLLARGMPEGRATLQIRYPVRMTTPGARTTSLFSGSEHFTDWQCPSSAQVTTLARLLWTNFQAGVNGFAGAIQNPTAGAYVSPVSTDCNPMWSYVTNRYWWQNKNDGRNSGGTLLQKLTLKTFNIWHSTNGPMDQWTNGPMDQWTNGLMD